MFQTITQPFPTTITTKTTTTTTTTTTTATRAKEQQTRRGITNSSNDNEDNNINNQKVKKPKVHWLDLNGSGLSAIERLCLEEALLRHDPLNRSWAIVGSHDPLYSTRLRYRKMMNSKSMGHNRTSASADNESSSDSDSGNINRSKLYQHCIIIMGIGGKPERLLNVDKVRDDGVLVVKRFSGGGTVVVDHSSLWTTFIGRTDHFPHVPPYPKDIMRWSADDVFSSVFERMGKSLLLGDVDRDHSHLVQGQTSGNNKRKTLVMDTKSCGLASGSGQKTISTTRSPESHHRLPSSLLSSSSTEIPKFVLRENDYVLGEHKMGGNAQSITSGAWLHHTSFLWDYINDHMEYLTLPDKRPTYRGDRHHDDFLVKLKNVYGSNMSDVEGKKIFFEHVKGASADAFELEEVKFSQALQVVDDKLGGFQSWFEGKCRTRIIQT